MISKTDEYIVDQNDDTIRFSQLVVLAGNEIARIVFIFRQAVLIVPCFVDLLTIGECARIGPIAASSPRNPHPRLRTDTLCQTMGTLRRCGDSVFPCTFSDQRHFLVNGNIDQLNLHMYLACRPCLVCWSRRNAAAVAEVIARVFRQAYTT